MRVEPERGSPTMKMGATPGYPLPSKRASRSGVKTERICSPMCSVWTGS